MICLGASDGAGHWPVQMRTRPFDGAFRGILVCAFRRPFEQISPGSKKRLSEAMHTCQRL